MVRKLLKHFLKKNCKRHIEWSVELKNNEEKGYILYIKRKGYENLFNSWLDKKGIIKSQKMSLKMSQ